MSYIIYISFMFINMYLIKLYDLSHKTIKNKKIILLIVFIIIYIFGSIRYDVGSDYSNYVGAFRLIINETRFYGPDYFIFEFLSEFFSFSDYGYIAVFSIYFSFTLTIILLILKKYNILFWGLFTFITFGFFFDTFDRIRQMAALSLFILSLNDIAKNQFLRFFIKILFASLFHVSAIALLPFYFIAKIPIHKIPMTIITVMLLIGYFLGFWTQLIAYIYSIIPHYNEIYINTNYSTDFKEINTGLGVIGKIIFIYLNILFAPIHKSYKTLLFVGLVIYIVGIGNLNIERVANYFLAIVFIIFPLVINSFKKNANKIFILMPMILFLFIIFIKSISQEYFQYQTIFSSEFQEQNLKKRIYH